MERKATLQEIETHWSLDDVIRMNACLDSESYYNKLAQQEGSDK